MWFTFPAGLSCKNASELHVSAVCLWWLRWPQSDGVLGAGQVVSLGTPLHHSPEGANKCSRSYFLAWNIHILRSEPTTVSMWATNKQLCASCFGKQNLERNRGRVKGIAGSNRKEVVPYQSSRFLGRTSLWMQGWSVAAIQAAEGQAHNREVLHLLFTREYFDIFSAAP